MRKMARELERIAKELVAVGKKAPKGKYAVELEGVPNVDFDRSSWNGSVSIGKRYKVVNDLNGAKRVCENFIDKNNLGGGNWTGGRIYDDSGDIVGYISYNGRAWENDSMPSKPIKEL